MKIKNGFMLREVCGEHLIVATGKENIDFNCIIALNDTATFIWENMSDKDFTVDDITKLLLDEYEVTEEQAHADSTDLAKQWIEAGIVEGPLM